MRRIQRYSMIEEAYKQAINVLNECVSDIGFKASALNNGYREVWGRDSMITLIGAMSSGEKSLLRASVESINTLCSNQTELGLIPNNVDVENNEAQFRSYMDGNMWYVIGIWYYYKRTSDKDFLKKYKDSAFRTLEWLRHQDVDNSGMISTQEAANWMDIFHVRGKVLYDNILYSKALLCASEIAEEFGELERAKKYKDLSKRCIDGIQYTLWVDDSHSSFSDEVKDLKNKIKNSRHLEEEYILISQKCAHIIWRPYFLAYRTFRYYGNWFDTLGNSLAIIFNIAGSEQTKKILEYAAQVEIASPYAAKATYPPIYPGDAEWREYFLVGNLNLPNHYHNGGIWPFVGGFYISALVKAGQLGSAANFLQSLAEANKIGRNFDWEFNEWFHGNTGKPMGKEKQAWSAAMYVYAYNCVKSGVVDL